MNAKQRRHRSFQDQRRIQRRYPNLTRRRGIDYGGLGSKSNRDTKLGIRYGIISMNALSQWAWESVETEYTARCPDCGEEVTEDIPDEIPEAECEEWYCPCCQECHDNDHVYGDEPDGNYIDEDGIKGFVDSYNDLMIVQSPYYTYAQFCSPCAPGAGHLENYCPDGVRTFCLSKDWFKDEWNPYPIYSVATGKEIK